MKCLMRCVLAAMAASIAAPAAGAQELRIGFLTNYAGSGGRQGLHQRNGWELGLEHEGWRRNGDKLGEVPMRLVYGDDQAKPDVGLKEIDKMLSVEKVHMVAGFMWSNVLMAARQRMLDAQRIFMSTIPGASPLAGRLCTPLFVNLAQNNDLNAEALGELATADKIKSVYVLVPNYQGGKDIVSGFRRGYRGGKVIGQSAFKLGGKVDDIPAFAKALRGVESPSVRGRLKFNENGFLIETYYKLVVEKNAKGRHAIVNRGVIFRDRKDPFWQECPKDRRL